MTVHTRGNVQIALTDKNWGTINDLRQAGRGRDQDNAYEHEKNKGDSAR